MCVCVPGDVWGWVGLGLVVWAGFLRKSIHLLYLKSGRLPQTDHQVISKTTPIIFSITNILHLYFCHGIDGDSSTWMVPLRNKILHPILIIG